MNNTTISTADLSDALEDSARIAAPGFHPFGKRPGFSGVISTVKCFEDNSLVRAALQEPAEGRVLVVDGGGSMNCALLGDMLASMAADNGLPGIIVNGCIRDSAVIANIDIGVRALGTHPRKSVKMGRGQRDIAVHFAGIDFTPGEYVYVDEDGILVTDKPA
jgi:regulator of ribonuclease activity A